MITMSCLTKTVTLEGHYIVKTLKVSLGLIKPRNVFSFLGRGKGSLDR